MVLNSNPSDQQARSIIGPIAGWALGVAMIAVGLPATVSAAASDAGPKAASVPASDAMRSPFCPSDGPAQPLDLTGVKLVRQEGIPLMYRGHNNIEGPVWYDGALYYSNLGDGPVGESGEVVTNQATIWRWVPGSPPEVWLNDAGAGTNGMALDHDGRLVVARQLNGSISRIDWQTRAISQVAGRYEGKRFNSPNDLTIGRDGSIYFTDPNWNTPSNVNPEQLQGGGPPGSLEPGQRVYRVDANGIVRPLAVTELVPKLRDKPNGILLSLDEQRLYVGGLQGLWVFALEHGQVSQPQQLLSSAVDGMTKDCAGNIYAATSRPVPGRQGGQVVVVLDGKHRELGVLEVPGIQHVTNAAFGGDDGKTLFVTSLSSPTGADGKPIRCGEALCQPASIYTAKLPVPGFPY